jgi:hypothetical protein
MESGEDEGETQAAHMNVLITWKQEEREEGSKPAFSFSYFLHVFTSC